MATPGTDDSAGDDWGDALTPEEQAVIADMEQNTPMPERDEGGPAPTEQPEPKEQADTDEDTDETDDDGKGQDDRPVSRSALLRVKEQSKKYREELAAERAARAKLEGRFEILAEAMGVQAGGDGKAAGKTAPANPWDEEDIDPANDIFAAFDQQKRRNAYERQQREALVSGQAQRDQQAAAVNAYVADAKRLAAENIKNGELVTVGEGEAAKQVPAFAAAYMHVVALRDAQLKAFGVDDAEARKQQIAAEERQLVEESIAAGRSPAETIMGLAKAGGFKMPTKAATDGVGTPKTEKQLQAERHLEQVQAGMRASQSLSGRGGRPANGMDAKHIASMGEDEFAAFVSQMGEEKFARLYLGADDEYGY